MRRHETPLRRRAGVRGARWELREITVEGARREQRKTEIVRPAGDREYWKLEGCSSLTQWLARITSSDYGTAKRVSDDEPRRCASCRRSTRRSPRVR